jgi:chitin synthase
VCSSLSNPQVDPFGNGWAERIFTFLRYLCVLLIASQFILSMGNRPQGYACCLYLTNGVRARLLFTISMSGFAIIMAYTLFATTYLTVKSVESALSGQKNLMGDNIFTNVAIALLSTAGLYLLSSLLYFDPWHMLSCFLQFTLLLPSFVCTLQIYAFCNT